MKTCEKLVRAERAAKISNIRELKSSRYFEFICVNWTPGLGGTGAERKIFLWFEGAVVGGKKSGEDVWT